MGLEIDGRPDAALSGPQRGKPEQRVPKGDGGKRVGTGWEAMGAPLVHWE